MPAEGWYIDGEPLENYGRVIENRDGWDDTPGVRGENVVLLGRHGEQRRPKKYGPGRKVITMSVHGVNPDGSLPPTGSGRRRQYEASLDSLLRLISDPTRTLDVVRVYADGNQRHAACEVINPITPSDVRDDFGRVQFELHIPGCFWRDVDARPYRLRYDVAGADEQTVEVYSLAGQTAPCSDAVVTVTGPCTSVTVRDARNGSGFGFGALGAGEELVVDVEGFSAEHDGDSVLTDLTLYDVTILELSPAPSANRGPDVTVDAPGAATGFQVVIEASRSWLR